MTTRRVVWMVLWAYVCGFASCGTLIFSQGQTIGRAMASLGARMANASVDPEVMVDGTKVGELEPGSETAVEYSPGLARLAQLPGANFYHRIREKFGHLAV